jgi:hypothetical protein
VIIYRLPLLLQIKPPLVRSAQGLTRNSECLQINIKAFIQDPGFNSFIVYLDRWHHKKQEHRLSPPLPEKLPLNLQTHRLAAVIA